MMKTDDKPVTPLASSPTPLAGGPLIADSDTQEPPIASSSEVAVGEVTTSPPVASPLKKKRKVQIRPLDEDEDEDMDDGVTGANRPDLQSDPDRPRSDREIVREQVDLMRNAPLVKIVLENHPSIPDTGQFLQVNGQAFLLKPGVEATVPEYLLDLLENAQESRPVVDEKTGQIAGYQDMSRLPFRIVRVRNPSR